MGNFPGAFLSMLGLSHKSILHLSNNELKTVRKVLRKYGLSSWYMCIDDYINFKVCDAAVRKIPWEIYEPLTEWEKLKNLGSYSYKSKSLFGGF